MTEKVDAFTKKVNNGKEKYTAYINDTCAETAKDILDDSGIETPDADGYVLTPKDSINDKITPYRGGDQQKRVKLNFEFATPYAWHANMIKAYGRPIIYNPNLEADNITLTDEWTLKPGEQQSVVPNARTQIHGDLRDNSSR